MGNGPCIGELPTRMVIFRIATLNYQSVDLINTCKTTLFPACFSLNPSIWARPPYQALSGARYVWRTFVSASNAEAEIYAEAPMQSWVGSHMGSHVSHPGVDRIQIWIWQNIPQKWKYYCTMNIISTSAWPYLSVYILYIYINIAIGLHKNDWVG